VTAIPLEADSLTAVPGAQHGFRYYLPRPYLLVTEIPAVKVAATTSVGQADVEPPGPPPPHVVGPPGPVVPPPPAPPPHTGRPPGAAPDKSPPKTSGSVSPNPDTSGPSNSSAPATDTSFVASNGSTYIAKLVYLPDYSHPLAVEMNTGLLGITGVQMNLQDGWMLTSVSANADNSKMGDVLTAAIQALSSGSGGGATKTATKAAAAAAPGGAPGRAPPDRVLRPGLYAFDYDFGISRVTSLCAVAYFDSAGSRPATGVGACGPDRSGPVPPAFLAHY
jgi:hypothetical protein